MRKGWEIKKLKDIGDTQTGNTPSTKEEDNFGDYIPFVKPTHFKIDGTIDSEDSGLSEKGLKSARLFKANSILMVCIGATIGKTGFTEIEVTSNQQINAFTPKKEFEPRFFYYGLISNDFYKKVIYNSSQATLPIINKSKWENLTIAFPKDKKEQQRIVSILDEAFSSIEQAKENLQRNLQNAKELFQSELNSIFTNKGEGWEEKTLGELTTKIGSGATPRGGNESYKSEGISLIRSMNVHDNFFKEKNLAFIDDKQAKELANVTLEEGDVLLNITGASVARCCVIPIEYLPARVNQHVSILRPKKGIVDSFFLNHLLLSKVYKDQLLETGEQGSTRQAITKVQLVDFKIKIPSIIEQQKIVQQLDKLSTETKRLEAMYQQKLDSLEDLKKSILQKAFSGELSEN